MPDRDELFTTISRRKAAELLSLSTRTLKRMEQKGLLHPIKINARVVRYRRDQVLQILTQSQT